MCTSVQVIHMYSLVVNIVLWVSYTEHTHVMIIIVDCVQC